MSGTRHPRGKRSESAVRSFTAFLQNHSVFFCPTRLFPPCFPSCRRAEPSYLAFALHDFCGKPIPAPSKCHSVRRRTSVPTENTDACRWTDCVSRTEPATVGTRRQFFSGNHLDCRGSVAAAVRTLVGQARCALPFWAHELNWLAGSVPKLTWRRDLVEGDNDEPKKFGCAIPRP